MTFPYQNFVHLTQNTMLNILAKQNVPPSTKREIIKAVKDEKARLRALGAQRLQYARLWGELQEPLDYEIRLVRRMQTYEGSPERTKALAGYMLVLEKLRERIHKLAGAMEDTPSTIAKAKMYPNNGVHWSDWVKVDVKDAVLELFAAIPRAGVKVKIPFERKIPKDLHTKLKTRLRQRTVKEIEIERRLNVVEGYTEERASRIKRMEQALGWIDSLEDGEAMPTTWHGFFK